MGHEGDKRIHRASKMGSYFANGIIGGHNEKWNAIEGQRLKLVIGGHRKTY